MEREQGIWLKKRKLEVNNVPTNVTCATTNTTVNVISSGGNKYVFNGENTYDSSKKYGLYTNTYVFKDVPSGHPIAILNNGNSYITYTGDNSKNLVKQYLEQQMMVHMIFTMEM